MTRNFPKVSSLASHETVDIAGLFDNVLSDYLWARAVPLIGRVIFSWHLLS